MLKWFKKRQSDTQSLASTVALFSTPLGSVVQSHCIEFFETAMPDSDPHERRLYSQGLVDLATGVAASDHAVLALRHAIDEQMHALACYQVISLKEGELSAMRLDDIPYISGKLHHEIERCVEHNSELKRVVWERSDIDWNPASLIDFCNLRCKRLKFTVNGLNKVRIFLKDHSETKDWYQPFFRAMLIWWESHYRDGLGLEPLLPAGSMMSLQYSMFSDFVEQGNDNPLFSFEEAWRALGVDQPHYLTDESTGAK